MPNFSDGEWGGYTLRNFSPYPFSVFVCDSPCKINVNNSKMFFIILSKTKRLRIFFSIFVTFLTVSYFCVFFEVVLEGAREHPNPLLCFLFPFFFYFFSFFSFRNFYVCRTCHYPTCNNENWKSGKILEINYFFRKNFFVRLTNFQIFDKIFFGTNCIEIFN